MPSDKSVNKDKKVSGFLKEIWTLEGYYVVGVHFRDGKWEWFTTDPEGAEEILEKYKAEADIYYGVNPRKIEPRGKGSDSDIVQADVFFADIDYKERRECEPGIRKDDPNTFELEACYEEGGKTVYVHRPPLSELLQKLKRIGYEKITYIIDSGNGYQLLWKHEYPLEAKEWKKREEELVKTLQKAGIPVDIQVKDISRVLRLPGSINQRNGREAKIIYRGESVVFLTEKEQKIIEAVLPCFKKAEDRRFELVGHLSGYLARHGFSVQDAEAIVLELYAEAGIGNAEHVKDVKYTFNDYQNGGKVTGFPELQKLCEELGSPINTKLLGEVGGKKERKQEIEEGEETVREERPIQTFDRLKIYHDFQHGKAYVSTYKAVREKKKEKGIEYWENVVKRDKTYINEDGNISVITDEEQLKEEYLYIEDILVDVEEFPDLNLPTEIKTDVKISESYKKVLEFIKGRITFRYEEDYVLVAVWVLGSYFYRVFTAFPYLAPLKSGYNSGGTELLWALSKIMPRPKIFNDPTPASIYTSVDQKDVTQLFDEFRENTNKDRIEEIKNILRVGYRKSGVVQRVEMTRYGRKVYDFNAYSPKVIIDQSLVTSEYDIASRCVFTWLVRDPRRKADVSAERPKDLINELYSVFLKYAPNVDFLYKNLELELTGRYEQLFKPLIVIARLIDAEDETLHVSDQLMIGLQRSMEFSESVAIEGDPQKKVVEYVIEYIRNSLEAFVEGRSAIIPKPWHVYSEGEGEVYIFLSDLRKEIMEYAVEVYQKDISYKFGEDQPLTEREWKKADPEVYEMLKDRKFTALLKKFFPENVREHRHLNAFFLKIEDYSKIISLNFAGSSSRVGFGGIYTPPNTLNTPHSQLSQSSEQKYESPKINANPPGIPPQIHSESHSEIKIQENVNGKENTKSDAELSFNTALQSTNKIRKWDLTNSTRFPLDSHSEIKSKSGLYSKEGVEKNNPTLDRTAHEQEIYDFLKKLSEKVNTRIRLNTLTKDELKLVTELKEKGLVNVDSEYGYVWLTLDGYIYLEGNKANDTVDQIIRRMQKGFNSMEELEAELRRVISEVTGCPDKACQDLWIKAVTKRVMEDFRRTVSKAIREGIKDNLIKRKGVR